MKAMKNRLIWLWLLLVPLACGKQAATGTLRLSLSSVDIVEESVKASLADYGITLPQASDFTLTITNAGKQVYWSGPVSEWTGEIALVAGHYSIAAVCGTEGEEGFEKPWFGALQEVDILAGQAHDITLTATLANTMLKVAHTEMFDNYFKDCSLTFETGNGTTIPYPEDERRPVFVEAYRFSIRGSVTARESGKVYAFEYAFNDNINAATCYTLRLGADTVGGVALQITFNDQVETIKIEEDLYE